IVQGSVYADLRRRCAEELAAIYQNHFTVFRTAVNDPETIKPLLIYLKEHASDGISAFAGASAAGKSTLMNLLFPSLSIVTGSVSHKTQRGRHTTRHVELFPLCQLLSSDCTGFIADTPGFSMLDFERFDFFDKDELPYTFREFRDKLGTCRYTRCTHLREEGCAICDAVRTGEIPQSRHDNFIALYQVLKQKNPWDKKKP
ncbi:MAG: ribosome small subunit-dependent GTPase A, partial [Clostridia bacterium]|nr:ribosome small subunit-dependent GTPase A [Clostridia bacterium]